MKVLFVRPNKDDFGYKPIGLSLLSAIAKELGWETKLFDTTEIDFGFRGGHKTYEEAKIFKPIDFAKYGMEKKKIDLDAKFREVFKEYNPDVLAFNVLSDQAFIAGQISKIAKEMNSRIPIIWGGVHPTLTPEDVLREYDVDFVCIGDGIGAFKDFLTAFSENTDLDHIPNIWAKKAGAIIRNEVRPLEKNLDELPYLDWDIFDNRHFYKPFDGKIYIGGDYMSNWGCPNNCTYCVNHFNHELYKDKGRYFIRRYSVKRTIDELGYLKKKYNLEFLKFFDEDFLMRPLDELKELSEAYK
ncbi:MAG: cobalamin-dependent protein, partial [Candidatus Wildermuthbacteria bacterium]|nr:cobalamin-dependent protein [Candidatus Wildermuthbacteria bacterium]